MEKTGFRTGRPDPFAVIEKCDEEQSLGSALSDDYIRIEFGLASGFDPANIQGRLGRFNLGQAASDRSVKGDLIELLPLSF